MCWTDDEGAAKNKRLPPSQTTDRILRLLPGRSDGRSRLDTETPLCEVYQPPRSIP